MQFAIVAGQLQLTPAVADVVDGEHAKFVPSRARYACVTNRGSGPCSSGMITFRPDDASRSVFRSLSVWAAWLEW